MNRQIRLKKDDNTEQDIIFDRDQVNRDLKRIMDSFQKVADESKGLLEINRVFLAYENGALVHATNYTINCILKQGFGFPVSSGIETDSIERRSDDELYEAAKSTYLRWKRIVPAVSKWAEDFNGEMTYVSLELEPLVRTKSGAIRPVSSVDPDNVEPPLTDEELDAMQKELQRKFLECKEE